ncbi:hypothetical protein ACPZ19_18935 [Amycolatopsis lurida]
MVWWQLRGLAMPEFEEADLDLEALTEVPFAQVQDEARGEERGDHRDDGDTAERDEAT